MEQVWREVGVSVLSQATSYHTAASLVKSCLPVWSLKNMGFRLLTSRGMRFASLRETSRRTARLFTFSSLNDVGYTRTTCQALC